MTNSIPNVLVDRKSNIMIRSNFDKYFSNDKYELFFNTKSGLEVLMGRNGLEDPFYTELPTLLDVGIMGHCNHNCNFCYQGDKHEPNMKLADFIKIIHQIKHHVNQVALGGRGDPNKHNFFNEIVSFSRMNNVVPNYTTSGLGLTQDEVQISKQCGAVAVSDYEKPYTYKAIQKFINAGIKTNVHLIFSRQSYTKCMRILDGINPWVDKDGMELFNVEALNAVIFLLFKPQGKGINHQELIPTPTQLLSLSQKILSSSPKFKIGLDSCLANHVFLNTKVPEIQRMAIDSCEASRMSSYITPDMKMLPCSFANHNLSVPIDRPIEEIWQSSNIFNKFRSILKFNPFSCPAGF